MNWIKKTLNFGEKIKKLLKVRPTKEDIENSDWTSCCKGPILKKDLEENLWFVPHVENIIELPVDKDLIYFLAKIIMRF